MRPVRAPSGPYALVPFGDGVAFVAYDDLGIPAIWFSNGTPEGTVRAADTCPPGDQCIGPEALAVY